MTVSPLALLFSSSNDTLQKTPLITAEEVCRVLATCKPGKSCGQDGVSYELLQLVMQTECSVHLVDMFNSVLFQSLFITCHGKAYRPKASSATGATLHEYT